MKSYFNYAILFISFIVIQSVNTLENDTNILDCFYKNETLKCVKEYLDSQLDGIELNITGKNESIKVSNLIEQTSYLVVDEMENSFDEGPVDVSFNSNVNASAREARKKKFGKKKKKLLQKLMPIFQIVHSKISLILQLISTHFQFKFFAIAVISLLINIARFWVDLKKGPGKVIYYEHAQHQHHYEHDDDVGYWKRSLDSTTLPFAAWFHQQ